MTDLLIRGGKVVDPSQGLKRRTSGHRCHQTEKSRP